MLKKYNTKNALSNNEIKNKMTKNLLKKYNVNNVSKLTDIKNKKIKTLSKTWINRLKNNNNFINIVDVDYTNKILICECDQEKNHIFKISYVLFNNRKEFGSIICTKCNKIHRNVSSIENKYYNFLKDNYDDIIIRNDRKIIKPYELDIYLPKLKIAFEFNGFKWHDKKMVGKNYHKMKSDMCDKNNINLYHFYQDVWMYKEKLIKNLIKNILNKKDDINLIDYRINNINNIKNIKIIKKFLNENHIEGYIKSEINLGLFNNNNELISLMTFDKININEYKILRISNKIGKNIHSECLLLNFFIKKYKPNKIFYFENRSYPNNYIREYFDLVNITEPNLYLKNKNEIFDSGNKEYFINIL